MLFEKIIDSDITILNLGIRDHAQILGQDADLCTKVFSTQNHTCHVCSVRSEIALEIDHTSGHKAGVKRGLKSICQFCHDLKHPLWSASRGRIIPIWGPDLMQVDLIRMSWMLIGWRDTHPTEYRSVISDLISRKEMLEEFIGWSEIKIAVPDHEIPHEADALFEAAFSSTDMIGRDIARPALRKLDQLVRFIPHEIMRATDDKNFQMSSRLSTWTVGGFKKISRAAMLDILKNNDPDIYENAVNPVIDDEI